MHKKYGSQYRLEKAVAFGDIYKIEDGIYSDNKRVSEIAIIDTKYSKAVITGEYTFYYHGPTYAIP